MIPYNFVSARKEEQFCTCTAVKLYRYSVNAREKEHFCIGSKSDPVQCKRSFRSRIGRAVCIQSFVSGREAIATHPQASMSNLVKSIALDFIDLKYVR